MPPKRAATIPAQYVPSHLTAADRRRQIRSIRHGTARPRLASFKSRPSKWVVEFKRRFGHELDDAGLAFIDKYILDRRGIDQVLAKGRAAYYTSGSRPNQTAESWARARLAAVVVGSPGARKADRAIWEAHRRRETALYRPFVSESRHKKYSVIVPSESGGRRTVHFGDNRYEHYRDRIGAFAALNHGDRERRRRYYQRHGPSDDRSSAKYWSHKILW